MSNNILLKSFSFCFSKFHCLPIITFSTPPPINDGDDDDQLEEQHNNKALFKNFNSLYDVNNSDTISTSISLTTSSTTTTGGATTTTANEIFSSTDYDSDTESIPDFTSAFASHRFFFSTPGSSNSIFQPPESLSPPLTPQDTAALSGGVAVQTYSPDPYVDFRKSMQEMIGAREMRRDIKVDWEFLNELLLCYLTLNPKHTHKFIVGAFSDVIVSLLLSPAEENCRKFHHQSGHCGNSELPV